MENAQVEAIVQALVADLALINFEVTLGDLAPSEQVGFLLPIWYAHASEIALVKAANQQQPPAN